MKNALDGGELQVLSHLKQAAALVHYSSLLHTLASVLVEARVGRSATVTVPGNGLRPKPGLIGGVLVIKCEFDSRALLRLP